MLGKTNFSWVVSQGIGMPDSSKLKKLNEYEGLFSFKNFSLFQIELKKDTSRS